MEKMDCVLKGYIDSPKSILSVELKLEMKLMNNAHSNLSFLYYPNQSNKG